MEAECEKPAVTETNLRDEYYWKLVADFIGPQSGEGLELEEVPCTNRVLIQVGLMRDDNNFPWLTVTEWLQKIFPKHRSADFRCLIEQGTATMQSLGSSDQQNFLDSHVNFNFIGPVCGSIGVERRDLLEMRDFSERAQSVEVTNGLILELNSFVAREEIAPIILVNWLRNFNPVFCKDGNIHKAYKSLRPKIKKLKQFIHHQTTSHRRKAAMDHLLQSPFELVQKKTGFCSFPMKGAIKQDDTIIKKVIVKEEQDELELTPSNELTVSHEDTKENLKERLNEAPTDCGEGATLMDIAMLAVQKLSKVYGEKTEMCRQVSLDLLKNQYSLTSKEHVAIVDFESKLASVGSEGWLASPVTFLHANASFVVDLHEEVDRQIMGFENEIKRSTGGKLGRDQLPEFQSFLNMKESATSRYIHMACDILHPGPSSLGGYRKHWVAFCREKQNPSRLPAWNQSGRFNSFLKAAASLTHHYTEIGLFFSDMLAVNNEAGSNIVLQSVTADASDAVIQNLMCVLALIYCKVLGPYLQLLKSQVEYALFGKHTLSLYQRILDWYKDPKSMLVPEEGTNIFGQIPLQERTFTGVFQYCSQWHTNRDLIAVCLKRVLKSVARVMEEHLMDFLPGGSLSHIPPPAMRERLSGCTLSVLMAEYPFSLLYTKKTNQSMDTLDKDSESESESSVEDSRSHQRVLVSEEHKCQSTSWKPPEKPSVAAPKAKLKKKASKRRKGLEGRSDLDYITATVQKNGGPCRTRQDFEKLLLRFDGWPRAAKREAVRCEFLYQKMVLNNKHLSLSNKLNRTCDTSQQLMLALPRVKPGYSLVLTARKTQPKRVAVSVQGNVQENMLGSVQDMATNPSSSIVSGD